MVVRINNAEVAEGSLSTTRAKRRRVSKSSRMLEFLVVIRTKNKESIGWYTKPHQVRKDVRAYVYSVYVYIMCVYVGGTIADRVRFNKGVLFFSLDEFWKGG